MNETKEIGLDHASKLKVINLISFKAWCQKADVPLLVIPPSYIMDDYTIL